MQSNKDPLLQKNGRWPKTEWERTMGGSQTPGEDKPSVREPTREDVWAGTKCPLTCTSNGRHTDSLSHTNDILEPRLLHCLLDQPSLLRSLLCTNSFTSENRLQIRHVFVKNLECTSFAMPTFSKRAITLSWLRQ